MREKTDHSCKWGEFTTSKHLLWCTPRINLDCLSVKVNDMPSMSTTIMETVKLISLQMTSIHLKLMTLTIHPEKCHLMILTRDKFIGPLKEIKLDNKPITVVNDCKCLGVTIDKDLNFVSHISNVCKAFSAKVKKLYNIRSMSQGTLKTIYFQGILPSALYGIIIWGSSSNLNVLNDIHIRAARYIMKIKKSVPKDRVLQICNWNSMGHYYKKSIACKLPVRYTKYTTTNHHRY